MNNKDIEKEILNSLHASNSQNNENATDNNKTNKTKKNKVSSKKNEQSKKKKKVKNKKAAEKKLKKEQRLQEEKQLKEEEKAQRKIEIEKKRKVRNKKIQKQTQLLKDHLFLDDGLENNELNKKEKEAKKKIMIKILGFFVLLFVLVVIRILILEITHSTNGVNLIDYADNQYSKVENIESKRGGIFDSTGEPLAVNVSKYKVYAVLSPNNKKYNEEKYSYEPYYVTDPDKVETELVKDLGYTKNEKAKNLIDEQLHKDPKKNYQVEFGVYGENISVEQKEKIEAANLNGIYFEESTDRYYPYGEFASYILGYAKNHEEKDNDGNSKNVLVGEMGIEKTLDSYLKGQDGQIEGKYDSKGISSDGSQKIILPKIDGANVYLTIDSVIQSFIHDSMKTSLKKQKYDSASTMVIDAHTGAILGAESFPNFDPNIKNITTYQDPFYQTCFEPGSVMKSFLVATAMEDGVWNSENKAPSGIRTNDKWGTRNDSSSNYIADWLYNEQKESWGSITWAQGYYFSSNVVMTYILDKVGYDKWIDSATNRFEFGKDVEGQFVKSAACDFSPKYSFETATTTFGQGMTANIVQILRGYTAFSNDGKMVNPYIVKSINDSETNQEIYTGIKDHPQDWIAGKNGVEIDSKTGQYSKKVISKDTVKQMQDLMEGVMYYDEGGNFYGTGRSYGKAVKHKIGGKTGTSQIAINGSYNNNNGLYSVVALAPIDDPQIILYTSVLNPSTTYPNQYMKDYIATIIDNTLNYLNQDQQKVSQAKTDLSTNIVPNFIGHTNAEVSEIAKTKKIKYKKIGAGNVAYQYPETGVEMINNNTMYLVGKEFKSTDLKGLTEFEASTVCTLEKLNCQFQGSGKVQKVDVSKTKKYILQLK